MKKKLIEFSEREAVLFGTTQGEFVKLRIAYIRFLKQIGQTKLIKTTLNTLDKLVKSF